MNIIFCAILAFVQISICHLKMFIKFIDRLFNVALKTFFRTNHVVAPVLKTTTIIDPF